MNEKKIINHIFHFIKIHHHFQFKKYKHVGMKYEHIGMKYEHINMKYEPQGMNYENQ